MAEQSNPVWHQDELSDEDNPSWAVEAADTRIRIVWYLKKGGYRLYVRVQEPQTRERKRG